MFRARRKTRRTDWLTEDFIRQVHADMFGAIWEWGGKYRQEKLNIGFEPHLIREQVKLLTGDFLSWNDINSTMPVVEVAARLQHRLTNIHPFTNGNGRHARFITDIFLYSRKSQLPQWPQIQLMSQGNEIRKQYITAIKKPMKATSPNWFSLLKSALSQAAKLYFFKEYIAEQDLIPC